MRTTHRNNMFVSRAADSVIACGPQRAYQLQYSRTVLHVRLAACFAVAPTGGSHA